MRIGVAARSSSEIVSHNAQSRRKQVFTLSGRDVFRHFDANGDNGNSRANATIGTKLFSIQVAIPMLQACTTYPWRC
jgi:hypothetical protein